MSVCVYVSMCTFWERQVGEVENIMASFPKLKFLGIFLWAFELSRRIFFYFIFLFRLLSLKKTKAYSGSPRRQEGILFCNFSFHICIWIYDKADSKVYCINKSYEKRTETYYVNYAFIPREGYMLSQCSVWRNISQSIWI